MKFKSLFLKLIEKTLNERTLKKISANKVEYTDDNGNVKREDITNVIYKFTNGGTEPCTVYTIRRNDSKTDPTKKAGNIMIVNGKMKLSPKYIKGIGGPLGNARERHDNHGLLTLLVKSVDSKPYPIGQMRNFSIYDITKIVAGGETFDVV